MSGWKKYLLIGLGFGAGLGVIAAAVIGAGIWYTNRPHPPKPWNGKAILATYDYPDTASGPEDKSGVSPDHVVFYYILENTTDYGYRMPARDLLHLSGKLEKENSLTANDEYLTLGDSPTFVPAKQRMRIGIHLLYPVTKDFGPSESPEDRKKCRKAVADYMKTSASNLDGFVIFDSENRYRIDFAGGWKHPDSK